MNLHFFDIEATGVDPETAVPIEYAFINYETCAQRVIEAGSFIINTVHKISDTVYGLTRIDEGIADNHGVLPGNAIERIKHEWLGADYVVAHDGVQYDKPVLQHFFEKHGEELPDTPLMDTTLDIPFPEIVPMRNLTFLAGYYSLPVYSMHEALSDVVAMYSLYRHFEERNQQIFESADSPILLIEAKVKYEYRQLAKDAGFYWDPKGKTWLKRIKEIVYNGSEFSFDTAIIE